MANRYPLVIDTTNGNQLKELPEGDNLYLRNNSIEQVQNINAIGTIEAAEFTVNGETLHSKSFLDLNDTPSTYSANNNKFIKVKADGSGIEFVNFYDIDSLTFDTVQANTFSGNLEADSAVIGLVQIFQDEISTTSGDLTIGSPANIALNPTQHIWISQGTKLIFEGTIPDDFEIKLQALAATADRDLVLPDESGTLATQEWSTGQFISLDDLKTVVAASTDFADFQTRIASL